MECDNFLNSLSPLQKFSEWFDEAKKTQLKDPNATVLSTVGQDNCPHSRVVLLKELRPSGLVFFTNYESEKGRDLAHNPKAALHFFWDPLTRQVIWRGSVAKIPRAESEAYWDTRPRISQLNQWVSKQSQPVASREILEQELKKAAIQFAQKNIPCPENWGGYLLQPTYVEFWLGREGRSHDRYTYQKVENRWIGQRLYP